MSIDLLAPFRDQPGVEIEGSATVDLDPTRITATVGEGLLEAVREHALAIAVARGTTGDTARAFELQQEGDSAVVTNPLRHAPFVYRDEEFLTDETLEQEPLQQALQRAADESLKE